MDRPKANRALVPGTQLTPPAHREKNAKSSILPNGGIQPRLGRLSCLPRGSMCPPLPPSDPAATGFGHGVPDVRVFVIGREVVYPSLHWRRDQVRAPIRGLSLGSIASQLMGVCSKMSHGSSGSSIAPSARGERTAWTSPSVQGKTEIVRVGAALLVPCPESCSRLAGNSAAFRAVRLAMTKYIANMKRHITAHHSNSPTQAYQSFLIAIP